MKKQKRVGIICSLFVVLLILVGCQTKVATEDVNTTAMDLSVYPRGDYFITPQEVQELLGSEELVILDCNKPDLYSKEHIPGAISIGLHAFSDKVGKPGDAGWGTISSKEDLEEKLVNLGVDNDKTIVFYSNVFKGPGADGRAVWQLSQAGMDNVKILMGGSTYWKELGYEMTKEASVEPVPSEGVILEAYDTAFYATKDEIFNSLGNQLLLDVRSKKEFAGSQNAGEPRGGHIQGAKHFLWTGFLEENGALKSPEAIEEIMLSYGVNKTDDFTLY